MAGFSCAAMRRLFYRFKAPAYCVSEMLSAIDVISKHKPKGRYLFRDKLETTLCYQLSGTDAVIMAQAASKLESLGADIIDINCGCPKTKIRKKGAGTALLERPQQLAQIVTATKQAITIPLTVKIRINPERNIEQDINLAKTIENAGADCLIIHGRSWQDDYNVACEYAYLKAIKTELTIPVIANGDIKDSHSLEQAKKQSNCDGFMLSRQGCGNPWLYQQLTATPVPISIETKLDCFKQHIHHLAQLDSDFSALLQSRRLLRYYFRELIQAQQLPGLYQQTTIETLFNQLDKITT